MQPKFDKIYKRAQTNSIKWDFAYENGVLRQREAGDDRVDDIRRGIVALTAAMQQVGG